MGFCPKCGAKAVDGSLYCPGCGYKLAGGEAPEKTRNINNNNGSIFAQRPVTNTVQNNQYFTHPLAKAALVMSIICLSMIVFGFLCAFVPGLAGLGALMFVLGILGGIVSLGLSIPGLIITSKRKYKSSPAVAALILSIISVTLLIVLYVITYVAVAAVAY